MCTMCTMCTSVVVESKIASRLTTIVVRSWASTPTLVAFINVSTPNSRKNQLDIGRTVGCATNWMGWGRKNILKTSRVTTFCRRRCSLFWTKLSLLLLLLSQAALHIFRFIVIILNQVILLLLLLIIIIIIFGSVRFRFWGRVWCSWIYVRVLILIANLWA